MLVLRIFALVARALIHALTRALSPPACAACDAATSGSSVLCPPCARTLVRPDPPRRPPAAVSSVTGGAPPSAGTLVAAAAFSGAVAIAIRRFKYSDRPDLARPLGHLLRAAAAEAGLHAELIVPVPLHPRRLAERGYNQAALLAAQLAADLRAPVAARCLARLRNTAQQARLGRGDRLANVAAVFQVRQPQRVRGRAVLLVDDVATTGATLKACCDALLEAGAESVTCLVIAQAARTKPHNVLARPEEF